MTPAERAVRRAVRGGLLLGLVPFLFVLTGGRATLLGWSPAGDFYDEQGHALLEGHLDIDPDVLGIEAFFHAGRAYMYQPPVPAVLRLPVLAVTDDLDGRLGGPSVLLAALLAALGLEHLVLEVRRLRRDDSPASRLERLLAGVLGFSLLGAGPALFLATRPWVYHEAAMWGLAGSLAALAALLGLRRAPTWRRYAVLVVSVVVSLGARASVGLGPVAAVGLLALVVLHERRGSSSWRARLRGPAGPVALALAALLPVAAYAGLNMAKFGSPTSVPFDQQGYTLASPARQAMLAENGGTLFGLQFAPTTLYQYLRPVGARLTATPPYIDFASPGDPIGDVTFDLVDRTASLPVIAPGLLLLTVVGVVALLRRRGFLTDRRAVAAALIGALLGSATIIPFGYVAHRYLADMVPFLLLGGALGAAHLAQRAGWRRTIAAGALALAAMGAWTNLGLAERYQRGYVPNPEPSSVAGLVRFQDRVGTHLGRPPRVIETSTLPTTAPQGQVVALDGCAALYLSNGASETSFGEATWVAVERTAAAGHTVVELDLTSLAAGERHPVVTTAAEPSHVVWVQRDGSDVTVGIDGPEPRAQSRAVPIRGRNLIDVVTDPYLDLIVVRLGDQPLLSVPAELDAPIPTPDVGRAEGWPGIEAATPSARPRASDDGSLCRKVTR